MRYILSLLFLLCATQILPENLKDGDLIFQYSTGNSDFSNAIIDATGAEDTLNFVHVGIFFYGADSIPSVIDASPKKGVSISSFEEFITDEMIPEVKIPFVIKRLNIHFPVRQCIEKAISHLGEPYDWYFMAGNDKMYCSELVFESYLTEGGDHIFSTVPMNFRAPDGTMPQFWVELYERLGSDIPEGAPGTNPNDMARSPLLVTVPYL